MTYFLISFISFIFTVLYVSDFLVLLTLFLAFAKERIGCLLAFLDETSVFFI